MLTFVIVRIYSKSLCLNSLKESKLLKLIMNIDTHALESI